MKIDKYLSLARLAAIVSDACHKNSVEVVLSGGACVSIFTKNLYESYDLDFVLRSPVARRRIREIMGELGFSEDGRHFRHPQNPYIVEFLQPPLSVGSEPVRTVQEIRQGGLILKLLSPTDCVKDRLAAFYHWNDRPSLDQAILVCRDCDVDLREVRRWSLHEGMREKYEVFRSELRESGKRA